MPDYSVSPGRVIHFVDIISITSGDFPSQISPGTKRTRKHLTLRAGFIAIFSAIQANAIFVSAANLLDFQSAQALHGIETNENILTDTGLSGEWIVPVAVEF
jgi:hypothetical protein